MGSTEAEEYDFSADGLPVGEKLFTITEEEVVERETGVQLVLTFETPDVDFPIPVNYWIEHNNPRAAKIGRGNLKKIAVAATGQPKIAKGGFKGHKVLATLSEDDQGFARVSRFKKAPEEVPAVVI